MELQNIKNTGNTLTGLGGRSQGAGEFLKEPELEPETLNATNFAFLSAVSNVNLKPGDLLKGKKQLL